MCANLHASITAVYQLLRLNDLDDVNGCGIGGDSKFSGGTFSVNAKVNYLFNSLEYMGFELFNLYKE